MSGLRGTLIWGGASGAVAVGLALLPPVLIGAAGIRLSEYLASSTLILVGWLSQRGSTEGAEARLVRAAFVPAIASLMLGIGVCAYYEAHPLVLEARYEILRVSVAPASVLDLDKHRARFLSAGYFAANLAATAFFWGFLVAAFVAFRDRLARRRLAPR
jgi:hypothetical protein